MASTLSEEQFQCCICRDIFSSPVSIPCGHNFCLLCIKKYWRYSNGPRCPLCKEAFPSRPALRINKALSDITEHFKRSLKEKDQDVASPVEPDRIPCGVCLGDEPPTAVKSCLVCRLSYCQVHLVSHQRDEVLQQHQLTDPATFAGRGRCQKHDKPLRMFCQQEQVPVCGACIKTDHEDHHAVSLEKETRHIKTELRKTETKLQQMIQTRRRKVEEIKRALQLSTTSSECETTVGVEVFTHVMQYLARGQAALVDELGEKQRAEERRAEELICEVEREITDIQRRSAELEELAHMEDHLHLLQSFTSLQIPPSYTNWAEVRLDPSLSVGTARRAVMKLEDMVKELGRKMTVHELDTIMQYEEDVVLDPSTAATWLLLSPDGKQVSLGSHKNPALPPADPQRFDPCVCVLGKQCFTFGKHYWVVKVGEKTFWDVGVARASVQRKGSIRVEPDAGFWAVCRRKGDGLSACVGPTVALHLAATPRRVGVFVDCERGVVSFYDADAHLHIYTFSDCSFSEPLLPYFNPCLGDGGRNHAPLVICPACKGAEARGLGQQVATATMMRSEHPSSHAAARMVAIQC